MGFADQSFSKILAPAKGFPCTGDSRAQDMDGLPLGSARADAATSMAARGRT
jgi:hypothetical protein